MDFDLSEEQRLLQSEILKLARREILPRVQEHDREEKFDRASFRALADFGLLGIRVPESLGGWGADVLTTVVAFEALGLAGLDAGFCLSVGAHALLCLDTLCEYGTPEQLARYVPALVRGDTIGCVGITEPSGGSDIGAVHTRATRDGSDWVLDGAKTFITNGSISDLALVWARTDPSLGPGGVSCFIVETKTPGFLVTRDLHKLGVRSSPTSELAFDGCRVPAQNLLGRERNGFFMAMQAIEWDRSAILAPVVGNAAFILERSLKFSVDRHLFGHSIADFEATQLKLANMKIFYEASRALLYRIAWKKDQGKPVNHLEAAMAKLFVGDGSLGPTTDAVTLHGGYGYTHEYDVERVFRDARLAAIGGGTSEIQKQIISRFL
jgi:alkylation response protein AidB-like acyl-CoA dehydrogenase